MQFFSINQIGIGKGTKLFHAFTNRTNFSGKLLRICVYRRSVALQLIHSVAINIYIYVLFITRHIRFVHTLHSSTKKNDSAFARKINVFISNLFVTSLSVQIGFNATFVCTRRLLRFVFLIQSLEQLIDEITENATATTSLRWLRCPKE